MVVIQIVRSHGGGGNDVITPGGFSGERFNLVDTFEAFISRIESVLEFNHSIWKAQKITSGRKCFQFVGSLLVKGCQ